MMTTSLHKSSLPERILELLLARGQMTRNQLLEQLPVRPATLLEILNESALNQIIHEPTRSGRRTGRKASPIALNPATRVFVGLELDVQQIIGLCIDAQGQVLARSRMTFPTILNAAAAHQQLHVALTNLQEQLGQRWSQLSGVALADPGLVNTGAGFSVKAVNLPGWEQLPTGQWLREQTGSESWVVPAPLARAGAEFAAIGSPRNVSLFHMQIDGGIGGGFIKDGAFFLGDGFCAMEVGHVVVREGGPLCRCGNRGCLEAVAGLNGLRQQVADLVRHGVITALTAAEFSMSHLLRCVENGDKVAGGLSADVCEALGIGLASVVCILNPGIIVLSGELTGLGPRLLEGIQRVLARRCLPQALSSLNLRLSTLGAEGTAMGAAYVARREGLLRVIRNTSESGSAADPLVLERDSTAITKETQINEGLKNGFAE